MLGNPKELLFYLTSRREWWQVHGITAKQASDLRRRLLDNNIGKECMYDTLVALGCVLVRESYFIPSVWTDGNVTLPSRKLLSLFMGKRMWYLSLGFDRFKAFEYKRKLHSLPERSIDEALLGLGCTKVYDSMLVPSVWEYSSWLSGDAISDKQQILNRLLYVDEELTMFQ